MIITVKEKNLSLEKALEIMMKSDKREIKNAKNRKLVKFLKKVKEIRNKIGKKHKS